jgi:hypothetical protein
MAATALTYHDPPTLTRNGQGFLPVHMPSFTFEHARWSTTRTEKVEKIAEMWQKNPEMVRIFQDPKFGHMQMVLLRKDQLEALLKVLRDIESGQAAVQYDIQALFNAIGIIQDLVDAQKTALPKELEKPLCKAVNLIVALWGKVSSGILVQAPKRQVTPSPLSEEEQQPLED